MITKKRVYIPPRTLEEINNIKSQYRLNGRHSQAEAFKKMSELSRVGREVETMRDKFLLADIFGNKKKRRR